MDLNHPTERFCYARCNYCNIVLAVGVPCKRLMDTENVTVKCGHCNNISFLISPRPLMQTELDHHQIHLLGPCSKCRSSKLSSSSSSSIPNDLPNAPFVVKPPEKKHRLPSAYNHFMKEEIRRIKAAMPDIRHREAFSMASKNWAKSDQRATLSTADSDGTISMISLQHERTSNFLMKNFDAFKPAENKN